MRLQSCIEQLADRLAGAGVHCGHGVDNVHDEAVFLVFGALDLDFRQSIAQQDRKLEQDEIERLEKLVRARIGQRVPTAYLLGKTWFAGHELICDARALVPRSPIAELIDNGFEPFFEPGFTGESAAVLDLCCGGGCIGIACALRFPACRVDLADISPEALDLAQENVRLHDLEERVSAVQANLFEGLSGRYDLILANPPYVSPEELAQLPKEYSHEPALGLDGGTNGIDIAERLLKQAAMRLNPGGLLILETGYSATELENRFPNTNFLWLEFDHGGAGVCALTAEQLQEIPRLRSASRGMTRGALP
ncbi:MAG: 50S ribosomal protein L3 N(5)-glutamine methyltransferase [Gammaproteobacteria bacterium]|nr:50S ribosomal protein L3 N(5)-glutamine methyltransferase [Gammaproteobacteria bacterium]MYH45403.1 50S ribosomal protein L3 N(5)-glutamine methyltransferase [Gammaproteobacteria bacterium]MYL12616.1 50S ribosomal protein L3 N(5)-glutamine methyltransferase [Gammaproteobacteria bacterium]